MIKMKKEMRQEPSVDLPKSAPMPSAPNAFNVPKETQIPVKKITREESWTPTVNNKVERRIDFSSQDGKGRSRVGIWSVALLSLVFLFFAISFFFAEAEISITPKTQDVSFNQNLNAVKDLAGAVLPFEMIVISGEENTTVAGGAEEDIAIKARGRVVIYNNFSSATQRLDIDTRLEGSNGKLYKTEKQVVVPGVRGDTPGSVEVGIYAAEAGGDFNSPPLDFQIVGFRGTPKYSKFYARSIGDITGGFVGKGSVVSEEKKIQAANELKATLRAKLFEKASDLIPADLVLFEDAIVLEIDSENFNMSAGAAGKVPLAIKGTLYGFLFNEAELTKRIVAVALPSHDGSEVFISNLNEMTFTLLSQPGSLANVTNISFGLSGKPKVVWKFNESKLRSELLGKKKSDFNQILSGYPNVESADVVLRPLWKRSFPKSANDVKIMVNYPN